ncbi:MFS transporter [Oceaniglobus ichthyenteri]|uniref:MFS transporter n=1 Tax=Oceaniglobus ichthyenteri TaxID=2136177 RepID=UPI000D3C0BB7|nr:MFS transporter [Oceaniglobus ichthyenteri]
MSILSAVRLSRAPALAFAGMGALWGTFAAFVPVIKAGLGAGDAAFGLALLCSAIGLVMAMWLAPLADARLGRWALPVASAALSLAFLLPGLAGSLVVFGLCMALVGMGSGLCDVVMNARVSELEAAHDRSLMNLNHAMFSFAYAVAALITGFAREAGLPPIAMFSAVSAVALVATMGMRMPVAVIEEVAGAVRRAFPTQIVFWGGAIVLIGFMAENAAEGWSALHIERTLGGGAAQGAFGPAMLGLTMGIGRFSGQLIADRLRASVVIRWAAIVSAIGVLVAAGAVNLAMAYVGFALFGLGISVLAPMGLALVGRRVAPEHRTKAISRTAVIGFLGFFIGPPLMGGVAELAGLRMSFALIGVLLLTIVAMLVPLRRSEYQVAGSSQTRP